MADTFIYKPSNWIDPFDWRDVFGRDGPVEVDIGAGKGAFLTWAAQSRPYHNFLGVERRLDRVRTMDRKIKRLGLENVRLMRLEAGYLVGKLIPTGSVLAYHIYFPDPWPKRRHQMKRLIQPGFVLDLHRTLCAQGAVNVATDSPEYFRQMRETLDGSSRFDAESADPLPETAQTDFERVFLSEGKAIHRMRFRARAS
jgi:tRNA (guanine-N7-)-methyltransferase